MKREEEHRDDQKWVKISLSSKKQWFGKGVILNSTSGIRSSSKIEITARKHCKERWKEQNLSLHSLILLKVIEKVELSLPCHTGKPYWWNRRKTFLAILLPAQELIWGNKTIVFTNRRVFEKVVVEGWWSRQLRDVQEPFSPAHPSRDSLSRNMAGTYSGVVLESVSIYTPCLESFK